MGKMKCLTCRLDGPDYCLRGFLKHNAGDRCRYYEKAKLYLCGRITGDNNYYAKFRDAESHLFEAGFYPVNPAACVAPGTDWREAMRQAIGLMVRCDGIALLADWKKSKGAKIEERLARELEIPVKPLELW
jgi:hypothetical protein